MSKNSGVSGKTVPQLARSIAAAKRRDDRAARSTGDQLDLLQRRPGLSQREARRLVALYEQEKRT